MTVKLYFTPAGNAVTVMVVPLPVPVTLSGNLVSVHEPAGGRPLRTTLPVGVAHVGCVIVPITGGVGGLSHCPQEVAVKSSGIKK